jgi:hypothetical protein
MTPDDAEMISIGRPAPSEYAPYYGNYISKVTGEDVLATLETQGRDAEALLRSIPESQACALHPPYTWTIKQVVGHVIDAERVFAYRALRFARNDTQPLPGFDENAYVPAGRFERLSMAQLVDEFAAVRRATILLFRHLPDDCWQRQGVASGSPMSVRAAAYTIAGHVNHHLAIVRQRVGRA